ncbi:hypothetical protein ACFOS0_34390, partial [Nocardia seriolae]
RRHPATLQPDTASELTIQDTSTECLSAELARAMSDPRLRRRIGDNVLWCMDSDGRGFERTIEHLRSLPDGCDPIIITPVTDHFRKRLPSACEVATVFAALQDSGTWFPKGCQEYISEEAADGTRSVRPRRLGRLIGFVLEWGMPVRRADIR